MKIFYSWQSWTSRKTNWNFIQDAIKIAIKRIETDEVLEVQPVLDRDTHGKAGSVAIAETIFQKIDECQVFICDVTIVTEVEAKKPIPNPNVLIELGYAAARLGWENIICVFNEAYGAIDSMPFDLRYRRLLKYNLPESISDKAKERRQLADGIYSAIKIIIDNTRFEEATQTPLEQLKQLIPDPTRQIELEELIRGNVEQSLRSFTGSEFLSQRQAIINLPETDIKKAWVDCFQSYFSACEDTLALFATLSWYGDSSQAELIEESVQQWMEMPQDDEKFRQWHYIPPALLIYAIGISAIYKRNWNLIEAALLNATTQNPDLDLNPSVPVLHLLGEKLYLKFERDIRDRSITISQQVYSLLRPIFLDLVRSDDQFRRIFDSFEMLLGFCYVAIDDTEARWHKWMPPHNTIQNRFSWSYITDFWRKRGLEGNNWGLIGNRTLPTTSEVENALTLYEEIRSEFDKGPLRTEGGPGYLLAYRDGLSQSGS